MLDKSYVYRSAKFDAKFFNFFARSFTDLRNFTYRKKFSFLEVEVSQKLAKKDGKK